MAVDSDTRRIAAPEPGAESEVRDKIAGALRRLDKAQKLELIHFIDQRLADSLDEASLARVFEDGHTHIVWRTAGGPRQRLELIRSVAQAQA